jgi:hypothetical protein
MDSIAGMATTLSATGKAGTRNNGGHLGLALAVIAAAQLMVVLDATVVNVALPRIQAALGFSGSGLEWVVNAYALAFGGLLLLGGRAGDLLGRAPDVRHRPVAVLGRLPRGRARHLAGVAAGGPGGSGDRRRGLPLVAWRHRLKGDGDGRDTQEVRR